MTIEELIRKHNLFVQITINASDGAYPMFDCTLINLATNERTPIVGYDRYNYDEAVKYGMDAAEKKLQCKMLNNIKS